jgi:hypothetical protein
LKPESNSGFSDNTIALRQIAFYFSGLVAAASLPAAVTGGRSHRQGAF